MFAKSIFFAPVTLLSLLPASAISSSPALSQVYYQSPQRNYYQSSPQPRRYYISRQPVEIGRPVQIGTPVQIGRSVAVGTPIAVGVPVQVGRPIAVGTPNTIGRPASIGRPIAAGSPISVGRITSVGSPTSVGTPRNVGRATEAGSPTQIGTSVAVGQPGNTGRAVEIGSSTSVGRSAVASRSSTTTTSAPKTSNKNDSVSARSASLPRSDGSLSIGKTAGSTPPTIRPHRGIPYKDIGTRLVRTAAGVYVEIKGKKIFGKLIRGGPGGILFQPSCAGEGCPSETDWKRFLYY